MYIFGVWIGSSDRKPKRCRTSSSSLQTFSEDRLTSLPDDLLTRILSMLPTKDAVATQILSKRMRRPFRWISSIDLDDSLISYCVQRPRLIERFTLFESFIYNVLHKLSESQQPLTRFRLHLGGDKTILARRYYNGHKCKKAYCLPDPQPARLYAWISYPLAHCGLRELDLFFRVKNPAECSKLPPEIFACQSLEVLKLDIKLKITGESGVNEFPIISLPNLKLLQLRYFDFTEDDFVTRLVSNCPVLEDLSITYCRWLKADRLIISSHSLRRLVFIIDKYKDIEKNSDLLHIDTPNLQYFEYFDTLAFNYILHLNDLVEASINVRFPLGIGTLETSFRKQLSLARALSNVKHLSLLGWFTEGFYYAAKLKDPLPMFRNLRSLKLDELCDQLCNTRWDIVLLLIFHRCPLLEEVVFPEGFFNDPDYTCEYHDPNYTHAAPYEAAWEAASWGITQTTMPSCCEFHLKRIRIYKCHGRDQELNMISFLLGITSVLKELVISMSKRPFRVPFDASKLDEFKNTLEKIPRASNSCSIIYSDDEPNYN